MLPIALPRHRFAALTPVLFAALIAVPTARADAPFSIQTVDTTAHSGATPSLRLDSNGQPRIAYAGDTGVMYAHRDASVWSIDPVAPANSYSADPSLALSTLGDPHIAFHDMAELREARRAGSVWVIETAAPPSDAGWYSSLALDPAGPEYASSYQKTTRDLLVSHRVGGVWSVDSVDEAGTTGLYTSLVLDAGGVPHVSYHSFSGSGEIKYAYKNIGAWAIELVASGVSWGNNETSLALDAEGVPAIAYYDFTTGAVMLARRTGGVWSSEVVAPGVAPGVMSAWNASLAFAPNGEPVIAYYDATDAHLHLAVHAAGVWQLQTVDSNGDNGSENSLVVDGAGVPHLAYYAGTLRYAEGSSVTSVFPSEPILADWFGAISPNPVRSGDGVRLSFTLSRDQRVTFALYDVSGRRLAAFPADAFTAGPHEVRLAIPRVHGGIGFVVARTAQGVVAVRRVAILE